MDGVGVPWYEENCSVRDDPGQVRASVRSRVV